MAKPLRKPASKSSMSRFLDPSSAGAALDFQELEPQLDQPPPALKVIESQPTPAPQTSFEPPRAQTPPAPRAPQSKPALIRSGDLYLTPHTHSILEQLLRATKESTNRGTATTHILRGVLLALEPHLEDISRELAHAGPIHRPANSSSSVDEREGFELHIGAAIMRAVRRSR